MPEQNTDFGPTSPQVESARDLPRLVTIGRVSVDLYAEQLHTPIPSVTTFRKSIGGTATNVAVAAARLGTHAALVTKVGDDPFGNYVRLALEHTFGVDTRFVGTDPLLQTPLAFAELTPPENPNIFFYREPKAPDMNLEPDDLDRDVLMGARILWVPGSRMADEPSRSTVLGWLSERNRKAHVIVDLDWRPMFWPSEAEATRRIKPLLEQATIAIGNREECRIAVGADQPEEAAKRLLDDHGLEAAIVKLGGAGVLVARRTGRSILIPSYPVEVVCGLGSGDAFGGAFCDQLLRGRTLVEAARYGNAAGAVIASRLMCADDMPNLSDIENLILGREKSV